MTLTFEGVTPARGFGHGGGRREEVLSDVWPSHPGRKVRQRLTGRHRMRWTRNLERKNWQTCNFELQVTNTNGVLNRTHDGQKPS